MHTTLNIKQIFVSPYNHGSLVAECFIGSLANLIVANLSGNGRQWPLYSNAATYAYNTFSIPSVQGLSPYELVYGRKPATITGIDYAPMDRIQLLRNRLEHLGRTVLELQSYNQRKQANEQAKKVRSRTVWRQGLLVYLLSPINSSLSTNSRM